jgi:hypothetical protein
MPRSLLHCNMDRRKWAIARAGAGGGMLHRTNPEPLRVQATRRERARSGKMVRIPWAARIGDPLAAPRTVRRKTIA